MPNEREKASFLKENIIPIQECGQLKFIEESGELFPENILIRQAFGHTEAMMLPQFTYKNKTIIFMADLLPSTAHIPLPYIMSYDMFPLVTLNEKNHFFWKHNKMIIFYFLNMIHWQNAAHYS